MDREQRLDEVITEHLKALEAGQPIDEKAWLLAHADIADELRAFLAGQRSIERIAVPLRATPTRPQTNLDNVPTVAPGQNLTEAPLGTVRYFGDYELLEEIVRGGMGVVYKARQRSLDRVVALKMILAGQLAGEAEVQRFRHEAQLAARLQHPGIVALHEVGEHEGQHFFSMDYIEGRSLADLVRQHPLPAGQAVRYVRLIAEAVHFAHQHGVLHRCPAAGCSGSCRAAPATTCSVSSARTRSVAITASRASCFGRRPWARMGGRPRQGRRCPRHPRAQGYGEEASPCRQAAAVSFCLKAGCLCSWVNRRRNWSGPGTTSTGMENPTLSWPIAIRTWLGQGENWRRSPARTARRCGSSGRRPCHRRGRPHGLASYRVGPALSFPAARRPIRLGLWPSTLRRPLAMACGGPRRSMPARVCRCGNAAWTHLRTQLSSWSAMKGPPVLGVPATAGSHTAPGWRWWPVGPCLFACRSRSCLAWT